jgi:hypothetical protein
MLAVVSLATGCRREREYGLVEGTVTANGRPLADAEVLFVPDPAAGGGPSASAYTDEQGRYKLFTEQTGRPGAVVGRHAVCVRDLRVWKMMGASQDGSGGAGKAPPPARVPVPYTAVATTPLQGVEVKAGPQTYDITISSP